MPLVAAIEAMDLAALRRAWRRRHGILPSRLSRDLLRRDLAYTLQEDVWGGVSHATRRRLQTLAKTGRGAAEQGPPVRAGTRLVRAWRGRTSLVTVTDDGVVYDGVTYRSLSAVAHQITGAHWSGPRFFGLRPAARPAAPASAADHG